MRHPRTPLFCLLAATALIGVMPMTAAGAAPLYTGEQIAAATPRTGADGVADFDARRDVLLAERPGHGPMWPLTHLEGAEITVLDHCSDEIGRPPPTGLPRAMTSAISELDQARVDVLLRDASRARRAASASRAVQR